MTDELAGTDCDSNVVEPTDFGWALTQLRSGEKVCRKGWNGPEMWLALQTLDEHGKMTMPYIYMKTVQGNLGLWVASQTDLLAWDWVCCG